MSLYAPHLVSPIGNETYNLGYVDIIWNKSRNPSQDTDIRPEHVFYEIQYTENYNNNSTVWNTIHARIPWNANKYTWKVGKLIKSEHVRIRIRAICFAKGMVSEWSMSAGNFTINVIKLIAPAIINPMSNTSYIDSIQIILDETLTRNNYNQKVLYNFEYKSEKQNIDWTYIAKNIPSGTNIIKWDISKLLPSDDYVLRLTVEGRLNRNNQIDQVVKKYVYNIKIEQPGIFIIDTKPPDALILINNNKQITNQLDHVLEVYAHDETTTVTEMQLHECDAEENIKIGKNLSSTQQTNTQQQESDECTNFQNLLQNGIPVNNPIIGKNISYSTKVHWVFKDKSGLRKLEALVKDAGGNTSLQNLHKIFIQLFNCSTQINDMLLCKERVVKTIPKKPERTGDPWQYETISFTTEKLYFICNDGNFGVLEPYSRILYTLPNDDIPIKLEKFDSIYIFTYADNGITNIGKVFRDNITRPLLIYTFPNRHSKVMSTSNYNKNLYIGLQNGELWKFNGSTFALIHTFDYEISALSSDINYLYIGFTNSSNLAMYNGSTITFCLLG